MTNVIEWSAGWKWNIDSVGLQHSSIEAEAEKEQKSHDKAIQRTSESLQPIEGKLKKLTRCLLDGIVDEDSHQVAKEELIVEKTRLKRERQRFGKTGESSWIEPARRLVTALETLGKPGSRTGLS